MSSRRAWMLTVALVAAALSLVPATASALPNVKLKASENRDGPYVNAPGPNPLVVNTTGTEPKNLFVRASLVDDGAARVRLFERLGSSPGSEDYSFDWSAGRTDISHDAQTSGHLFRLEHGDPQRFRVRVTPDVPNPGDACLFPKLTSRNGETELAEAFFAINDSGACE